MTLILKSGALAADAWTLLTAEDAAEMSAAGKPAPDRALLPWEALDALPALGLGETRLGVSAPNDADLSQLAPWLRRLELIVLHFPKFADGRAFSQARRLRALGYEGTVRATGGLVADQWGHAIACGFDEAAPDASVLARQPAAQWRAISEDQRLSYQRAYTPLGGARQSILSARRAAQTAVAAE